MALLVFIVVQIVFIPFGIVGFILVFYKQMYASKKPGFRHLPSRLLMAGGQWI
jgi:hypothetical protein